MKEFDIKKDMTIIEAGGFFCQACLTGKPIDDISPDERYCQGCHDFLKGERKATEPPQDSWSRDGFIFTHYGQKYGLTKNLGTACLGGVTETSQDAPLSAQEAQDIVSKIPEKEIMPSNNIQAQDNGIMKQRGRPRKTGEVSRVTAWRREKEQDKQGVLL